MLIIPFFPNIPTVPIVPFVLIVPLVPIFPIILIIPVVSIFSMGPTWVPSPGQWASVRVKYPQLGRRELGRAREAALGE